MQNLLHLSLSLIPNIFLIERKEFLVSTVMSSVMMMPFPDYFRINFILRLMCICSIMTMVVSTSDVVIYYFYFEILVNLQVFIFMKKMIFERIYILLNCKIIYICSISNHILDSNKCSFSCKQKQHMYDWWANILGVDIFFLIRGCRIMITFFV